MPDVAAQYHLTRAAASPLPVATFAISQGSPALPIALLLAGTITINLPCTAENLAYGPAGAQPAGLQPAQKQAG